MDMPIFEYEDLRIYRFDKSDKTMRIEMDALFEVYGVQYLTIEQATELRDSLTSAINQHKENNNEGI